jgi:hypothetical protein
MPISNAGRPRKWPGQYTAIRIPVADREHYEAEAERHGMHLSSYLLWQLCLQTGRPMPAELEAELRVGQRIQEQLDLQTAS